MITSDSATPPGIAEAETVVPGTTDSIAKAFLPVEASFGAAVTSLVLNLLPKLLSRMGIEDLRFEFIATRPGLICGWPIKFLIQVVQCHGNSSSDEQDQAFRCQIDPSTESLSDTHY